MNSLAAEVPEFQPWPKIPRYSRDIIITEKIDGTNASVLVLDDGRCIAGSRNRWLSPEADNFGFAKWVREHEAELSSLGPGHHFGEWWGAGIQRRYGLSEKRFSLFNTARWNEKTPPPACCSVVPVLFEGAHSETDIMFALGRLSAEGSRAAPGFMKPEGIVIFHTASQQMFKKTIEGDEKPKGSQE